LKGVAQINDVASIRAIHHSKNNGWWPILSLSLSIIPFSLYFSAAGSISLFLTLHYRFAGEKPIWAMMSDGPQNWSEPGIGSYPRLPFMQWTFSPFSQAKDVLWQ
jgi:hypothetical protein